jgi:DNA-binding HxlR family transcriptional regulator
LKLGVNYALDRYQVAAGKLLMSTKNKLDTSKPVTVSNCVLLDLLSDKWSLLILGVLCKGPVRFNEIKRQVQGISQKSLTHSLRRLERFGLVDRKVLTLPTLAVEYSVTALGWTLSAPYEALREWTETYMNEVLDAQSKFDQKTHF